MKGQEITEAERVLRVHGKLLKKALALSRPAGPLLGAAGFVSPDFFDDLRALPPNLCERIEEYAQVLEEAARTGKLGGGRQRRPINAGNL